MHKTEQAAIKHAKQQHAQALADLCEEQSDKFQIEVVWNREFAWTSYGPLHTQLGKAIKLLKLLEDSGDGERVKKSRIVTSTGTIVYFMRTVTPAYASRRKNS